MPHLRVRDHVGIMVGDAHVAHDQICQCIGVVKAAVAGRGNHIVQVIGWQAKVWDVFKAPICVLDVNLQEQGMMTVGVQLQRAPRRHRCRSKPSWCAFGHYMVDKGTRHRAADTPCSPA